MRQHVMAWTGSPNEAMSEFAVIECALGPQSLWIGVDRLSDAFQLRMARDNTLWSSIVSADMEITVMIHATGDEMECRSEASRMVQRMKPVCNMGGMSKEATGQPIHCDNGHTYNSQKEAAAHLGVTTAAVNHVLKGRMKTVKGVRLWR